MEQGNFSHSLAEYTLAACNWFAKDFPRLRAQQKAKKWEPFDVEELRCFTFPKCFTRALMLELYLKPTDSKAYA